LLSRLGKKINRLRRRFGRSEWAARQLYPEEQKPAEEDVHTPGILMIQIDGLAYGQLLRAMDKKKVPFLQRSIQQGHFVLRKFYSGLPSATPAVQAELFFGVKSIVPAFKYFERQSGTEKVMFDADAVDELAQQMEREQNGLLADGSSYSNIFAGGAKEAPFCIQSMKLKSIFRTVKLRKLAWFIFIYADKILRIIGLSVLEAGLAVIDLIKGVAARKNPFKELKFVLSRIGVCIILRELIHLHVKIDIARGLPIIHANFVGYDEHSHRRNPSSAFALWTLKGIDSTIRDLVRSAMRSEQRDYHVFIYSDHGQEACTPFPVRHKRTLNQAIQDCFSSGPLQHFRYAEPDSILANGTALHIRSSSFFSGSGKQKSAPAREKTAETDEIHITAMGPLGHIYLPTPLEPKQMKDYCRRLVEEAGIPLVCYLENNSVRCHSRSAEGDLHRNAAAFLGADHPFLDEVSRDLETICRHEQAGDFVISGWTVDGSSLSFPQENGSHGGPGSNETQGFVILPDTLDLAGQPFLRPLDLRDHVRAIREEKQQHRASATNAPQTKHGNDPLTVMSYNIHSCVGVDGKHFPGRIARIIRRQSADIVALQEVDRNMERTGCLDQTRLLAEQLGMEHVFFPVLNSREGEYGLAVLSRFPLHVMNLQVLPRLAANNHGEKRGIMWVMVETGQGPVHLFNTHLSLVRQERLMQIKDIVEGMMLGAIPAAEPVLFCGDLNAGVKSPVYALLAEKLHDAQKQHSGFQSAPTFFSSYPLFRLDHIFHSPHLKALGLWVTDDWECRLASDHLPVTGRFVHDS
jgi:endonuclease/exonuclease/phosphatase family metal-dependent hydrolase